jgi:hypothetical protein
MANMEDVWNEKYKYDSLCLRVWNANGINFSTLDMDFNSFIIPYILGVQVLYKKIIKKMCYLAHFFIIEHVEPFLNEDILYKRIFFLVNRQQLP